MPKVTQEYMDNKRRMIVDCAYRVCLRKPVEMVTISDVIAETGLSQGGIYRFYKDLDEILSDMISGMRREYDITDKLDMVVADKKASFEDITEQEAVKVILDSSPSQVPLLPSVVRPSTVPKPLMGFVSVQVKTIFEILPVVVEIVKPAFL